VQASLAQPVAKRFVLIDRDGTLIVERHYLSSPEEVELIAGAAPALKGLQDAGWGICVVTNQSGISRGYFDAGQLGRVHRRLAEMLGLFDVRLDGIYVCPHSPDDECQCRKPLPGMVAQAVAAHGFDVRQAWVIGDKDVDIGLGHAVGARTILVRTGYGKSYESETRADFVADDLPAAAELILRGDG
jgi:D-glycero-D-manno-heptose 1,7-bisphosphate phosphatase